MLLQDDAKLYYILRLSIDLLSTHIVLPIYRSNVTLLLCYNVTLMNNTNLIHDDGK